MRARGEVRRLPARRIAAGRSGDHSGRLHWISQPTPGIAARSIVMVPPVATRRSRAASRSSTSIVITIRLPVLLDRTNGAVDARAVAGPLEPVGHVAPPFGAPTEDVGEECRRRLRVLDVDRSLHGLCAVDSFRTHARAGVLAGLQLHHCDIMAAIRARG